jgi:hypothetical protein
MLSRLRVISHLCDVSAMKLCAIALVVASMLSGCVSYRASKITATVGAGIIITGLVLAAVIAADAGDPNRGNAIIVLGAVVVAPGAVVGVGGLIGMAVHGARGEALVELPPAPELRADPQRLQQRSVRLKRAQEIADGGQRAKALLAIPVCEPVPVQEPARPLVNSQPHT